MQKDFEKLHLKFLSLQHHLKTYLLPIVTLHRRFPSVRLRDRLHHGQADSRASGRGGAGFVQTVKPVKQSVQIGDVRQVTCVGHFDADFAPPAVNPHPNFAAVIGISDRIVKQYGYHPLDGSSVSV